jgi:hypothetical protein
MKKKLNELLILAFEKHRAVIISGKTRWWVEIRNNPHDTARFDHLDIEKNIDDAIKFLTELDES